MTKPIRSNGLKDAESCAREKRFDVTIAGEINLDVIVSGLPRELPMERELLASGFAVTLGGSSAIVAHNLAALGVKVGFVTSVGGDPLGAIALDRLIESGADVSQVVLPGSDSNTGVTILLPHGTERRILTYPGTMAELRCEDLDVQYLAQGRHFHLSSLFLQTGLHPGLPELLDTLRARGLTISLDTNDDPADRWDGVLHAILPKVDIFLPNEDELLRMAMTTSLNAALAKISAIVPLIVVKRGARGALVYECGRRTEVEALRVTPIDTIGAGDSFVAGFLAAFLQGRPTIECVAAGNVTGALSTQGTGGTEAFRDATLRESFLREHDDRSQRGGAGRAVSEESVHPRLVSGEGRE